MVSAPTTTYQYTPTPDRHLRDSVCNFIVGKTESDIRISQISRVRGCY
jgi:hypothetical protein